MALAVAVAGAIAAVPLPLGPITVTIDGATNAAVIPFTPLEDGSLDLSIQFRDTDPQRKVMVALYDADGDLTVAGITQQAFDGHIEYVVGGDARLEAHTRYLLALDTTAGHVDATLSNAALDGAIHRGLFPAKGDTVYTDNRVRIPTNGYTYFRAGAVDPQPVVAMMSFATIHHGPAATARSTGHMCIHGPNIDCETTRIDIDHSTTPLAETPLIMSTGHVELTTDEARDIEYHLEVTNWVRRDVIELQVFWYVPTNYTVP